MPVPSLLPSYVTGFHWEVLMFFNFGGRTSNFCFGRQLSLFSASKPNVAAEWQQRKCSFNPTYSTYLDELQARYQ